MILIMNLGRCLSHVSCKNGFSADFLVLWTLNTDKLNSCVYKKTTFCGLFTNRLRVFHSSYSNSNSTLPLLIGDMRCSAKQSLAAGAGVIFSYKCSHTVHVCCISARLYSFASRQCLVQFIQSFCLFGPTRK